MRRILGFFRRSRGTLTMEEVRARQTAGLMWEDINSMRATYRGSDKNISRRGEYRRLPPDRRSGPDS